ncbi:MAG: hypothetical protein R2849_00560 [Thermomicrobiales bacterium]
MADVGDTIVLSGSRETESSRTWLFENRLDDIPLLGADTLEAGVPVVAWMAGRSFCSGMRSRVNAQLDTSGRSIAICRERSGGLSGPRRGSRWGTVDFRMSVAVDHERVHVGVQPWRSSGIWSRSMR